MPTDDVVVLSKNDVGPYGRLHTHAETAAGESQGICHFL